LAETASPEAPPAASPQPPSAPLAQPLPAAQLVMAVALAWLVPGLGHVYLKRAARGLMFFALVAIALVIGCSLSGNLYRSIPQQWLTYLATFGQSGMGIPYFVLRYLLHYEGQVEAPGYEYGTAFLLTAGLMNLLLVLDVWDIGSGQKE
jgi:TM2 domain-containing membrane protein YozV